MTDTDREKHRDPYAECADASALQNIRTASEIERDRLARKAARRAELADDIKWTDWDGAVNTDQPIFDALAAATQIDTEPDGFPRIVISASKFIEAFNNHRDRALCTSLRSPPIPDGRIAREALEAIIIRCEEGDKNFDWRSTIADIAKRALALPDQRVSGWQPTDAQVRSACLSYRHDFGLLTVAEAAIVKSEAREWLRAWQKELKSQPLPLPPERVSAGAVGGPDK